MAERGDRRASEIRPNDPPPSARGASRTWTGFSPKVLRIAKGIHVVPALQGHWEVRTLGAGRIRECFATLSQALSFALGEQLRDGSDVVVHLIGKGARRIKVLEAEPPPEPRDP